MVVKGTEVVIIENNDWDECDKKTFTINIKVMNILFCALNKNEFNGVFICKISQNIWKILEVAHESDSIE